jgi:hypothetical protein
MTTKWAKDQPKDGDVILHCGHLRPGGNEHWFHVDPGMPFTRPDKTTGVARWIIGCPACAAAADYDASKIKIRSDATWIGDEPFIPAPTKN